MAGSVRLEPVVTLVRIRQFNFAERLPNIHADVDNSSIELRQKMLQDVEQESLAGNPGLEAAQNRQFDPPTVDPTSKSEIDVPDYPASELPGVLKSVTTVK